MNGGSNNLLSQLRDIHGAAGPGWWPPAWGWWVLAVLVAAVVVMALRYGYRRWLIMCRRRRLMAALKTIVNDISPAEKPHEYLSRLNRLFRVVALQAFPDTACARLQGVEWVRFIRSKLPRRLPTDGLAALANGPYEPSPDFDAQALNKLARVWVGKHG